MKYLAFTVYDIKVEAHLSPIFLRGQGEAIRAVVETSKGDLNHGFARYPSDYTLYLIGSFDDVTGRLTQNDNIINLGTVSDLVKRVDLEKDKQTASLALKGTHP